MLWEALGSALVGLVTAWAALRFLPRRFPSRPMTVATSLVGALVGGLITRFVMGPGDPGAPLLAALAVAAAAMSLLVGSPGTSRPGVPGLSA